MNGALRLNFRPLARLLLGGLRLVRCWWARVADAAELVAEAELHVVRAAIARLTPRHPQKVSRYARSDLDSMRDSRAALRADLALARERL
jgi:hypothetical protein